MFKYANKLGKTLSFIEIQWNWKWGIFHFDKCSCPVIVYWILNKLLGSDEIFPICKCDEELHGEKKEGCEGGRGCVAFAKIHFMHNNTEIIRILKTQF